MDVVLSKNVFSHPYNYAQARFAYPLFHQKLETCTGWISFDETEVKKQTGENSLMRKVAREAATLLLSKFSEEYDNECKYMTVENYFKYADYYDSPLDKIYNESQIFIYLCSSPVPIDEPPFDTDFKEERVCIKHTDEGPVLLHEEEEILRQKRDKYIKHMRSKLNDGSYINF
jgi:hypothetical protein